MLPHLMMGVQNHWRDTTFKKKYVKVTYIFAKIESGRRGVFPDVGNSRLLLCPPGRNVFQRDQTHFVGRLQHRRQQHHLRFIPVIRGRNEMNVKSNKNIIIYLFFFNSLLLLPNVGPDMKYLLGFIRTQMSTTVTIALVFGPKVKPKFETKN